MRQVVRTLSGVYEDYFVPGSGLGAYYSLLDQYNLRLPFLPRGLSASWLDIFTAKFIT